MAAPLAGKKVFLLNPPTVVGEDLIDAILAAEYELYVIKDPRKALSVFRRFPDSIVFVNIDSDLSQAQWLRYVERLLEDERLPELRIGVLSYNPDPSLVEKYLMELGIQCGFIRMKVGVKESTRIMLRALEANEARGRRRYVRADCSGDGRASFNLNVAGRHRVGTILDISSVGMAVRFNDPVAIAPKTLLPEMQLRLRATLVRVDAVMLGRRDDDDTIYVILFKHERDGKAKRKIRDYINKVLQESVDKLIDA
jgi:hypothetical protein